MDSSCSIKGDTYASILENSFTDTSGRLSLEGTGPMLYPCMSGIFTASEHCRKGNEKQTYIIAPKLAAVPSHQWGTFVIYLNVGSRFNVRSTN